MSSQQPCALVILSLPPLPRSPHSALLSLAPSLLSFMLVHAHLLLGLALRAGLNVGLRSLCQLAAGKDRDLGHETSFAGCLGLAGNSFMACSVCPPVPCLPGLWEPHSLYIHSFPIVIPTGLSLVPLLKKVLLASTVSEGR